MKHFSEGNMDNDRCQCKEKEEEIILIPKARQRGFYKTAEERVIFKVGGNPLLEAWLAMKKEE